MNKHVQIRNLPDDEHRRLKERAASQGLTITDYVKRLIDRDLRLLSWKEYGQRMAALEPVEFAESSAQLIRNERDSR